MNRGGVGDDPVVFDIVDLNIGGGYNIHTGVFTPPVAGLYFFSMYANSNGDYGFAYIKKNSDVLCRVRVSFWFHWLLRVRLFICFE